MIMLVNHSPAIPLCVAALMAHQDGHITLEELFVCMDTIERTLRIKKRHTKGHTVSRTAHTGEPRALPSCCSSSLHGASPLSPHTPAPQGIKHPIIEAHYGV